MSTKKVDEHQTNNINYEKNQKESAQIWFVFIRTDMKYIDSH